MVSVPGVIAAMDMGVRSTTCDIIAVVDDDVQLQPDWLERCLCHYADPSVIGVGGRDIVHERGAPCEALQARVGHVTWYGRIIGNHHRGSGMARPVDVLKGANMSLRRHYWVLDKRLHGTGAQVHWEVQVCLRVRRQNGTLIYDPGCLVDHFPAQRFDNDQRGAPTRKAIADACHNEVYILLTYLAWWQRIPYLLYTFVIGRRGSWAALRWIMIRSVGESVSFHDQLIPSYRGKLTGLVSWLVVSKWRPLSSIYHVSAIANGDRYADNTPPTIRERIA